VGGGSAPDVRRYIALPVAALHPDRVDRTVLMGCPAFIEDMVVTTGDRLALLPGARHLLGLVPAGGKSVREVLRRLGHGASLDAGRIPDAVVAWATALQRYSDTMRNEFAAMAVMGAFRGGFDRVLDLEAATLAAVRSRVRVLWGEHEVYGAPAIAPQLVAVLGNARLDLLRGSGHLCWLDDPVRCAGLIREHLLAQEPIPR
jgi:2-hydroxy-6-oxonona-2,4-dienedioate hydrolase